MAVISGIGRLGKDPKMQYSANGNALTNFPVSVHSGYGDKEKTIWLSVVCFGKVAETLNQYLKKGSRIDFSAELTELRQYEKQDGSTGFSLDAKLLTCNFVDGIQKQDSRPDDEPEEF